MKYLKLFENMFGPAEPKRITSDQFIGRRRNLGKDFFSKQEQEQSNINNITETIQVQKEPALLENITSNTPSSIEKVNNDKSENMKTIVIKDQ